MKSAEKWYDNNDATGRESVVALVKQIQLDAMKEGARRAADTVMNTMATGSPYENRLVMQSAILTTAEQWTEKDL